MPKITTILSVILLSIAIGFTLKLASAWVTPNVMPPGGNIAAPLNTSSYGQTKGGGIILNTMGAVYGLIVDKGNVGIGTQTPNQKLEVVGAIKIGNTDVAEAGTIRWTGTEFQGHTGEKWVSLLGSGGGVGGEDGSGGTIQIASAPGTLCGYSVRTTTEIPSGSCGGDPEEEITYEDYVACQGSYPSQGCPDGYSLLDVKKSQTEDNLWCVKD